MNLFRQLDSTFQRLAMCRRPPGWLAGIHSGGLDDLVTTIRSDRLDPALSDTALRALVEVARNEPTAMTVALYALAPRLRARLTRSVTGDYRHDALTELVCVIADSPLDGPRLAARLVNRAHNRAHKAAQRVHTRGVVNVTTIAPQDPEHFVRRRDDQEDIATVVARRVDLLRFHAAVAAAVQAGELSEASWVAYRDHRLRRAVEPDAPVCTSHQRTTASRAVRKLQPFVDNYLHAA